MKYIPKKKIDPVLKQTLLLFPEYPQDLVLDAIMHQFKEIRSYLEHPTHTSLLVRSLGRFIPTRRPIETKIRSLIYFIRRYPDSDVDRRRRIIKELWRRRRLAQEFEKQFSFIKRFSSWHYKRKNPQP